MHLIKLVSLLFVVALAFGKNDEQIAVLQSEVAKIDNKLKDNIWHVKYNNYRTYKTIQKEYYAIVSEYENLKKQPQSRTVVAEQSRVLKLMQSKKTELTVLEEYKNRPFGELTEPKELGKIPEVSNPFDVIEAYSYIKQIEQEKTYLDKNLALINGVIDQLGAKKTLLLELRELGVCDVSVERLEGEINDYETTKSIYATSILIYGKKYDDIKTTLGAKIKEQFTKMFYVFLVVVLFFAIAFFVKYLARKYISDNERFYVANKIINGTNYVLIFFVVIFSYIENASYLITFLGFAGAGIAIAMKDWFMSILGWLVMIIGGSVHVGDRIRVTIEGETYVGDVVDISLLRITLYEDVTLTSYTTHKRAGRVVFVPNNYIFTHLLANYSHNGIKTVWDEVEIMITFESNHKKASHIVKEIAKKYSKGYSDIARHSLTDLRDKYSLRTLNVEPRVFTFIKEYGVVVSVWFQTNSYATLTLKSSISAEIVDSFMSEPDIQIAYPTQVISMHKDLTQS